MTLPWLAPDTKLGRFFLSRPSVRTAILAYIIIVAVIYHVVLRQAVESGRLGVTSPTPSSTLSPQRFMSSTGCCSCRKARLQIQVRVHLAAVSLAYAIFA